MIGDRWGVSDAEVARPYGCDEVVRSPVLEAWRGVTVRASADQVWPWLIQIRLAPYSYDWIDNLGRTSPRRRLDLADPVVGDRFTSAVGGIPVGRVVAVDPGEQLTGRIAGVVMSYVVVPNGSESWLLLKLVMRRGRAIAPLVTLGDLVMARRQLLNFAHLAEGRGPDRSLG